MKILEKQNHYDLIVKYQKNFGYVIYNCTDNIIIGHHNFYNYYYVASLMKPIVLVIYYLKYNVKIDKLDLEKILKNSDNVCYIKYAQHVTKNDEDFFFTKFFNKSNPFSINIVDQKKIKNINIYEEYESFKKKNFNEKVEILKEEIDYMLYNNLSSDKFKEKINSISISFFSMKYFKKNIKSFYYNKGFINQTQKDYPKATPYQILMWYNHLFNKKYGNKFNIFFKYMKNINTSQIPHFFGMDNNSDSHELDVYHKTGNHRFFRNEILYFNLKNKDFILSYLSEPSPEFPYGISSSFNKKIMLSLINMYINCTISVDRMINSRVNVKYFSSYNQYPLKTIDIEGEMMCYTYSDNRVEKHRLSECKIIYNTNKIKIKYNNNIYTVNNICIVPIDDKILLVKTFHLKTNSISTDKIKGDINIFLTKDHNMPLFYIRIPLIDYLMGVIYHESIPKWISVENKEYIKAFSIVVKNYVINRIINDTDVLNNSMFQIYKYYKNDKIKELLKDVYDIFLLKNGLICSYFSSSCGGKLLSYDNIQGRSDIYKKYTCCDISPYNFWTTKIEINEFKTKLYDEFGIENVNIIEYDENDLIIKNVIFKNKASDEIVVSFKKLKEIFGWQYFKSRIFKLSLEEKYVFIKGKGFGHHLGLCQWGAYYLSTKKRDYVYILKHYFQNSKLNGLILDFEIL